jgi:hypothetical protein
VNETGVHIGMNAKRQLIRDLEKAKSLIEHNDDWYGGYNTEDGYEEEGKGCLCATQAVEQVVSGSPMEGRGKACIEMLQKALPVKFKSIIDFNDSVPHYKVMELFDAAIQLAEQTEACDKAP